MDGYRTDTFQCAVRLSTQNKAHFYVVAEQLLATSFSIFCIKHLWDSVGRFLGCCLSKQQTLKPGLLSRPRVFKGVCTLSEPEMPS
jgi:hypothetical protein